MTVQKRQEEFDKVVANKEEEIFHLKNHNQILITEIKKLKNKTQGDKKLEKANQDFEKKLFEKDDEICHLKSHHQDLIEQIKKLEDEKESQQKMSHKIIST